MQSYQNVVVMRHGDRIDNFEPLWAATAARPWDPPLVEAGKVRAFCTGRKFRTQLGFPIHRVFVSPFLRCLQTAAEVVSALCAVDDVVVDPDRMTSDGVQIDPSKLKVASFCPIYIYICLCLCDANLYCKSCYAKDRKWEILDKSILV